MFGLRKLWNIVVNDGSNFEVLNNISGVVKMITENRAIEYSKMDEDHPTMIVMQFETSKNNFQDIQDILEDRYPGLCSFNVPV